MYNPVQLSSIWWFIRKHLFISEFFFNCLCLIRDKLKTTMLSAKNTISKTTFKKICFYLMMLKSKYQEAAPSINYIGRQLVPRTWNTRPFLWRKWVCVHCTLVTWPTYMRPIFEWSDLYSTVHGLGFRTSPRHVFHTNLII